MNYTRRILSKEKRKDLENYQYIGPDGENVLQLRGQQVVSQDESVILLEGLLADLSHSGQETPILKDHRGYYEEAKMKTGKSIWIPCMDTYLLQIKGVGFWVFVDSREYLLVEGDENFFEYVECPVVYDIQPAPRNQEFLTKDEEDILHSISEEELWEIVTDTLTFFLLSVSSSSHPELLKIGDRRGKKYKTSSAMGRASCRLLADGELYDCSYNCPPEAKEKSYGKVGPISKKYICVQKKNRSSALYYLQSYGEASDTFYAGESAMVLGEEQYFVYGNLYLKRDKYLPEGGREKVWNMSLQHRDYVQDPAPECSTPENRDEIRRLWAAALLGAWISSGKRHREKIVLFSREIYTYQKQELGSGVVIRDYGAGGGERIYAEGKDNSICVNMSSVSYLLQLKGNSKEICGWWVGDGQGHTICVDGKDYDTRKYQITVLGYDSSHPVYPEVIGSPIPTGFEVPQDSSFVFKKLSAKRRAEINAMKIPVDETNFFFCDSQKIYLSSTDEDILFLPFSENLYPKKYSKYHFAVVFGEKYTLCHIEEVKRIRDEDIYDCDYEWKTEILTISWIRDTENIQSEPMKLCISLYRKAYLQAHRLKDYGVNSNYRFHHLVMGGPSGQVVPLHWMEPGNPKEQFLLERNSPDRIENILKIFPFYAAEIDLEGTYVSNKDESILLIPLKRESTSFLLVWGQETLCFAYTLKFCNDLMVIDLCLEQPIGEYIRDLIGFLLTVFFAEKNQAWKEKMCVFLTENGNYDTAQSYDGNYTQVDGPDGYFQSTYLDIPQKLGIAGANCVFSGQSIRETDELHFMDFDILFQTDLGIKRLFREVNMVCNRAKDIYFIDPLFGGKECILIKGNECVHLSFTPLGKKRNDLEMKTSRPLSEQGRNLAAKLYKIWVNVYSILHYSQSSDSKVPNIFYRGKEVGTEKIFTFSGCKYIAYYLPECNDELFSEEPEEEISFEKEEPKEEISFEMEEPKEETSFEMGEPEEEISFEKEEPKEETSFEKEEPEEETSFEKEEPKEEETSFEKEEPEEETSFEKEEPKEERTYTGCLHHLWQVVLSWLVFILISIVMWWSVVDGPFTQRPFHVLCVFIIFIIQLVRESFLWYINRR